MLIPPGSIGRTRLFHPQEPPTSTLSRTSLWLLQMRMDALTLHSTAPADLVSISPVPRFCPRRVIVIQTTPCIQQHLPAHCSLQGGQIPSEGQLGCRSIQRQRRQTMGSACREEGTFRYPSPALLKVLARSFPTGCAQFRELHAHGRMAADGATKQTYSMLTIRPALPGQSNPPGAREHRPRIPSHHRSFGLYHCLAQAYFWA